MSPSTAQPLQETTAPGPEVDEKAPRALPLCVDLDGTLIKTDSLIESLVVLVRDRLLTLLLLPFWLLRGRAAFKQEIASRVTLAAENLPYRQPLVDWLRTERAGGRKIILATAADEKIARAVAAHLDLFDQVLASGAGVNLKGSRKRDALVKEFGEKGFAYAGDHAADLPIWAAAGEVIVVGASAAVERRARAQGSVVRVFGESQNRLKLFLKAIRVHQWLKNLLVFVPLFTAHKITDLALLTKAGVAFFAYSFCASAVYLANDLMDLEADRRHRSKSRRPFASGALPLTAGLLAGPVLLVLSSALALWVGKTFALYLAFYFVLTNAYTFALKREPLIDVLCLAGLYTLRIFAGAASTGVDVSMWLSALSMFGFLSLALVKRVSELHVAKEANRGALHGRGYQVGDLAVLSQAGITSGYLSILVFALYIHGEEVKTLYRNGAMLWFICPLIFYWISRVWLLTHRGRMHDDPVVFAVRDRVSYVVGVLALGIIYLAT